jgi:hypothetical protein
MKEDNTNTFRIHQYLNNNLTPLEASSLETEIKNNPVLAEEFTFQVNLKKASGQLYKPELLKVVDQQFSNHKEPNSNNRILIILLLLLTALGILYFALFTKTNPQTNQELFAKHMNHYELSNYRDANNELASLFKAYQDKSYNLVCDQAKSWTSQTAPTLQKAFLIAGVSCLQMDETDQAIRHLNVIPPSFIYYRDVQWYLALAYLKNDDTVTSIETLELLEDTSAYEKRARDLIKSLAK